MHTAYTYLSATFRSSAALVLCVLSACTGRAPTVDSPDSGQSATGGASTTGGAESSTGGMGTALGGSSGTGGTAGFSRLISQGTANIEVTPRPSFGGLVAANNGNRTYVVESRRDVEPGPLGLPWRSRFRLAAYDSGQLAWAYAAEVDDLIGDVAVHPSGDITITVEHYLPETLAYDLVRLTPAGQVVSVTTLLQPSTIPITDYAATDPQPLFRMKSGLADATTAGWVRLLADGEGLVAAVLSDANSSSGSASGMALGVMSLAWQANSYVERWARVVEGRHTANPAAWAYDELRWLEQTIRPFLARDATSGELLIGRAWNSTRCQANVRTFAEFTALDCTQGAVNTTENERLPLAVTRFTAEGRRLGTVVIAPELDAAEQIPFALAARDGQLAIVGSIVRQLPDGTKRTYPDATGSVDYDGYIGVYDGAGHTKSVQDFNFGRGDVLAALRWLPDGIVAVGSAGWDRWQGGMSIGKGADPCFVWRSNDGHESATRVLSLSDGSRHFNLHDLTVTATGVVGYGFSDAPMTHSADKENNAARTFGSLQVSLTP